MDLDMKIVRYMLDLKDICEEHYPCITCPLFSEEKERCFKYDFLIYKIAELIEGGEE